MAEAPQEKRRIIVDEDWKSQVEQERERLQSQESKGAQVASSSGAQAEARPALPAATFTFLVSTLATQGMAALGQLPDPVDQRIVVDLDLARHYIDALAMLQEKTQGNLSGEESLLLENALHQLRMIFVMVRDQSARK